MPGRKHLPAIFILSLVLGAWPGAASSAAPEQARELIEGLTERLFELVDERRAEFSTNARALQDSVSAEMLPHVDQIYSARLVLGRHGRDLSTDQIERFAHGMGELLMSRYGEGVLSFESRDQVEILPLAGDNDERRTRVRTRVRLGTGNRIPVDYVLRHQNGEWLVFDVIVEGISYVATFRNQIGEAIRRDGFDQVLSRIEAGTLEIEA